MRLDGKVVLITGASEGIGAACARAFRERGARLALNARREEKLRRICDGALTVAGDITDEAVRRKVVERTLDHYGAIDVLVNNAGMGLYGAPWELPLEKARELMELNFFAPLDLIRLVTPHMKERGSGAIVNVGSIAGKVTLPWMTLYSASKYALGSVTDGLRMDLKPYGIHCMTVCPGYVKTEFQNHAMGQQPPDKVQKGKKFAITAERCAADLVRGLERDARTVLTPSVMWLFVLAERLFPSVVDGRMAALLERK